MPEPSPITSDVRLAVAPSPFLRSGVSTQRVMLDVIIALIPLAIWGVYCFGMDAFKHLALCVALAPIFEFLIARLSRQKSTIHDGSAVITGLILGLSLPASAPWFVSVVATLFAIGIGKMVFGGLGQNIYNPAMVGRAFVMISFSQYMGASAYQVSAANQTNAATHYITQATPLSGGMGTDPNLWNAFLGLHNGSIGETSIPLILLGLVWLLVRRAITWEIPIVAIATFVVLAGLTQLIPMSLSTERLEALKAAAPIFEAKLHLTIPQHLMSGAFLFGAVFIITDPVTNPMARKARIIFAIGFAFFTWVFRVFSSYPEGVMFSVLLMNSLTPLIERFSVPKPVGGPLPEKKA